MTCVLSKLISTETWKSIKGIEGGIFNKIFKLGSDVTFVAYYSGGGWYVMVGHCHFIKTLDMPSRYGITWKYFLLTPGIQN